MTHLGKICQVHYLLVLSDCLIRAMGMLLSSMAQPWFFPEPVLSSSLLACMMNEGRHNSENVPDNARINLEAVLWRWQMSTHQFGTSTRQRGDVRRRRGRSQQDKPETEASIPIAGCQLGTAVPPSPRNAMACNTDCQWCVGAPNKLH